MANTISDRTYRDKYRLATLDVLLRRALIAEKICTVDNSDLKRIQSPYGSQPTAIIQAIAGTYAVNDFTTTDDTLTVDHEVIYAEHIMDFETVLTDLNVFESRVAEQAYAIANKIDQFVLNSLCDEANQSYSTPAGGFQASNINTIMSNLIAKVAGYQDAYKGMSLVIENTEVTGFVQAQATNGFSFADAALNNGLLTGYMGVDVRVTRTGTFVTATLGTKSFTNSGHRVFTVNGVSTYASPRGVRFEEKAVSGKTGMEVVTYGYVGFKLWYSKRDLAVDITVTA